MMNANFLKILFHLYVHPDFLSLNKKAAVLNA
jgi:hypothetical protein